MENLDYFRIFCSASVLAPIVYYLKSRTQLYASFFILFVYLIISAGVEAYGAYTLVSGCESNNEVYNFYVVAETIFYALFFAGILKNRNAWWAIVGSCYVFNFLSFVICLYAPREFAMFPWSGSCVLIGIYAMQAFTEQTLQNQPDEVFTRFLVVLMSYYFISGIIYAAHPVPAWCYIVTLALSAANNVSTAWMFHKKSCIPQSEHRILT